MVNVSKAVKHIASVIVVTNLNTINTAPSDDKLVDKLILAPHTTASLLFLC